MKRGDLSNIFNSSELNRNNVFSILNVTKSLVKNTDYYNQFMHLRKESFAKQIALSEPSTTRFPELNYLKTGDSYLVLPEIFHSRDNNKKQSNTYKEILSPVNDEKSTTTDLFLTKKYIELKPCKENDEMKSICNIYGNKKFIVPTLFDIYLNNVKLSKYPINKHINLEDNKYLEIIEKLENRLDFKHGSITKKVNQNDKYEVIITLRSITVEFIDINSPSEKPFFIVNIPFLYLPLIYLMNQEELQRILSFCLIFDQKFEKVEFDSNNFISLIKLKLDSEMNYEKHINNLKFNWLTNTKVFEINIKMPLIELSLKDSKLVKVLEINLVDTIVKNEFRDWEYFVLSYFSSFKKFRNLFNKCFSKDMNSRISKRIIYLDQANQDKCYDDTSSIYSFVHTGDDNVNLYYTINFFKLECRSAVLNKNSNQSFNYKHSRVINNFRVNFSNLNDFLRKFVDLDKLKIDEAVLDTLNEKIFLESEKRYNSNFKATSIKNRKNLQLLYTKLLMPEIIIQHNMKNSIETEINILNKELIKTLFQNPIYSWKNILYSFKHDLVEKNHNNNYAKDKCIRNSIVPQTFMSAK